MTIIFLLAVVTLQPYAIYSGAPQNIFVLVSLLVCLIPTTIGGLLSAIGIAGMDRMIQRNVIAMSGRAVEASGDVDVLLLDKTGTITLGNRQATGFFPPLALPTRISPTRRNWLRWPTKRPRAARSWFWPKQKYGLRGRELAPHIPEFIPFTAQTRMSGVNLDGLQIRKGAPDAITKCAAEHGNHVPTEMHQPWSNTSPMAGGTPLLVAKNFRVLGAFNSTTSSRAACANASINCAPWAFVL